MTGPLPPDGRRTEALAALRERYRATSATSVAALRRLAAQLAAMPAAPDVIEALRRELHRVHGTAGTYGFPEASRLAAQLEERAILWAADPALDHARRAAMTAHFAEALEARLGGPVQGGPIVAPPAAAPAARNEVGRDPASPMAANGGERRATPVGPDIVLVEDDPALVDMLRFALGTSGYSFVHYETGVQALEALRALDTGGRRPVILLDIDLPGLDGFSLHERLRIERPDAYATVFLTARTGEAEQLRAYRAGAMDYVGKPVNLRILMAKIPSWLGRSGAGPAT
jgi:CheY-like chemotaxis protein/HPt (histidine-containing phosphotransfer) domain-containing protein